MSDGQGHIYAAKVWFEDKAQERFGHLSDDELNDLSESFIGKIETLEQAIKKLEVERRDAQYANELLWSLWRTRRQKEGKSL